MGDQPRGTIGSESLVQLIREARTNHSVKAVVLRVDSPGGSAFASELIRQELELLQQSGKPVVVSMAGVAASGGYWIAATADEIWANPGTITGSIGIFGLFPTFENTAKSLGIGVDGVGTTSLSGAGNPFIPINSKFGNILQANIENGYQRFINLVARGRNMTPEAVDKIAQGRIWTGTDALELGLVDKLGTLDQAVASAAAMANMNEFTTQYLERALSPKEKFIMEITKNLASAMIATNDNPYSHASGLDVIAPLLKALKKLPALNDPMHTYSLCEACVVN